MCDNHHSKIPEAREAALAQASNHDWHSCLTILMHDNDWCSELAVIYLEVCQSEMRRLGKTPITRRDCHDMNPFKS